MLTLLSLGFAPKPEPVCPAPGATYFTDTIAWTEGVDMSADSLH